MTKTGTRIVTDALREIQVLDPTATAEGEQLEDGINAAGDLLDTWRVERLTIGGILINSFSLVNGTQSYTIGSGGVFNQTYPAAIEGWSVIPDDDAADPVELPMGRPYTADAWQQIRIKTQKGSYPTVMYYDHAYAAGLGNCLFHPIPNNADVDVRLYTAVPAITALVAATSYDMRPGVSRALTLTLALELADRYGKAATVTTRLEQRAARAYGLLKRSNIIPRVSPLRPEFAIGSATGRRTFNVYQGR